MKNERWTEDLYLYRIKPAPPKKDDFQEYIALYCAEKDDKYLNWFFHYYEPRLNTVIMQTVQETAMQGHFADLKQAYIFGVYKALQKYDISTGVPFLIFKEHYVKTRLTSTSVPCGRAIPCKAWTNTERSERQWRCMQNMSISLMMKQ